jgi:Fe-S-cluster formation regulator IscX/YfhJ
MPAKLAELDDPQLVRFYRLASELLDSDVFDDPQAQELADILAGLLEQGADADEDLGEWTHDDLPVDLLEALADESDPRMARFRELMRERGWAGWIRPERVAEPPGNA